MSSEYKHLEHIAALNAVNGETKWSSWSSPVGLIIFFNGLAIFAILVRFAFLMK